MNSSNSFEPNSQARKLVLEHGWTSTCYQILNPGITHWFNESKTAVVGYVVFQKTAIVAGAPICSITQLEEVVEEFENFLISKNLDCCYFGAEERLRTVLERSNHHSSVELGSQPEWHPQSFVQNCRIYPSLRSQLNRAQNKNVLVSEWTAIQAENHPELTETLTKWLESRGLPPLHFLVEYQTLSFLKDRRIFVATQNHKVIGFVTLCPSPARQGWLTEQFVRNPSAPNGTVELMLYHAAKVIASENSTFFTMGMIPLFKHSQSPTDSDQLWLRILKFWANAHLVRFYNFKGLGQFKAKFIPDQWRPIVVYVRDKKFRFQHLFAISNAFTQIHPLQALFKAILRAGKSELKMIRERLTS